ncbi:MAG: ornithine cyclodeaminase family protein [Bacillota bacterium]|nr:ornithine cyclodeaminase family protein [Bacillota bacterium]MDD3298785.1 ornithine cyclodeaminase family protein [Bacillota bacterium]MDD3850012.1 ornithine cyclodeaminase family protein [Bacillota bacterium]
MKTILLSEKDIKKLITMREAIDITNKTFADLGKGNTLNPTKLNLNLGDSEPTKLPYKASLNAMPAYIGWQDIAGMKWAGGFGKGRKEINMPFINALILLVEPNYGDFLAVMDGTWITKVRTGAQSAAILRYLLKDKKKATFGMYGAGVQARTQTMALTSEFYVEKLIVYDPVLEAANKFKEDMNSYVQGEIVIVNEPKDVVESDAFISITPADDAFIKGEWLYKGSIYLAMGSYQECDDVCILDSDIIIVDHIGQCLHRGNLKKLADQGKITEKDIYCTIGELAAGLKSVQNLNDKKTLIVPIGMGCLDVAVAAVAYRKALSLGVGNTFMFDQVD